MLGMSGDRKGGPRAGVGGLGRGSEEARPEPPACGGWAGVSRATRWETALKASRPKTSECGVKQRTVHTCRSV